jgi:hypothetical protein
MLHLAISGLRLIDVTARLTGSLQVVGKNACGGGLPIARP